MNLFQNNEGRTIEVETLPLFSTPLIVTKYNDHENFEFEEFERVDRKPKYWTNSVNTSFPEIKKDDPYISEKKCKQLKLSILEHIKDLHACYNLPLGIRISQFWYNAYYEGQGQELHNHLAQHNINPLWSGIYFAKNCFDEQLSFSKNDLSLRTQQNFNFKESAIADYYGEFWSASIPDGYICLFPPHLQHTISIGEENRDKMRLTFSFNVHVNNK